MDGLNTARGDFIPGGDRILSPGALLFQAKSRRGAENQGEKMFRHTVLQHGRRAFSVAGPMFWNLLPRNLRDPSYTAAVFGRSLKTIFFS